MSIFGDIDLGDPIQGRFSVSTPLLPTRFPRTRIWKFNFRTPFGMKRRQLGRHERSAASDSLSIEILTQLSWSQFTGARSELRRRSLTRVIPAGTAREVSSRTITCRPWRRHSRASDRGTFTLDGVFRRVRFKADGQLSTLSLVRRPGDRARAGLILRGCDDVRGAGMAQACMATMVWAGFLTRHRAVSSAVRWAWFSSIRSHAMAGNVTPGDAPGISGDRSARSGSYRLSGNITVPDAQYYGHSESTADHGSRSSLNGCRGDVVGPVVCVPRAAICPRGQSVNWDRAPQQRPCPRRPGPQGN